MSICSQVSAATLYIGVTGNLDQRIFEHDARHDPKSFASRYDLNRLVSVETYPDVRQAIAREKQLKGRSSAKKIALVQSQNPEWRDLSANQGFIPWATSTEAEPSTSSG